MKRSAARRKLPGATPPNPPLVSVADCALGPPPPLALPPPASNATASVGESPPVASPLGGAMRP